MELILSIFIGIGLAAAVGFRIFIPFLIASIAAYTGNLELSTYFGWIGTLPALIAFSVATVIEIFSYYIPWVDNFLDAINHPLAIFAGIILSGAVVTDFPPLIKWSLALDCRWWSCRYYSRGYRNDKIKIFCTYRRSR